LAEHVHPSVAVARSLAFLQPASAVHWQCPDSTTGTFHSNL
jgi:hypothetical protein